VFQLGLDDDLSMLMNGCSACNVGWTSYRLRWRGSGSVIETIVSNFYNQACGLPNREVRQELSRALCIDGLIGDGRATCRLWRRTNRVSQVPTYDALPIMIG
jgi:hypothetical protein